MITTNNIGSRNKNILIIFLLSGFVSGCGSMKTRHDIALEQMPAVASLPVPPNVKTPPAVENVVTTEDLLEEVTEVPQTTTQDVTENPPSIISERKVRIPVELNEHVQRWITYFTERDRERFQRFLNRGQLYRDVVENVLEENDLPAELYYLAMIESGFRTDAHSHASAVGVWQFIPGTARRYGLRIDRYVDERRDPIRATEAAAKYLRDLYNVFGSWHLAMAAYNAGEIRVLRAVFKGRTRNFWELIK